MLAYESISEEYSKTQGRYNYFVSCTDAFMSGWGTCENRKSKFVIACETYEQATTIANNLEKANKGRKCKLFLYINIHCKMPFYNTKQYHASIKTFGECSAYNH